MQQRATRGGRPELAVIDTVSSLGPLARKPRRVTLEDLVLWHGHSCDGLVAAAIGLCHGLPMLFEDGPVDRTDLCVATNGSACYGDVAAYLTGARHRYGSLHVDPALGDEWVVHRRSTATTLRIRLRAGIKPSELPGLEPRLRAAGCPPDLMRQVADLQARFTRTLLAARPQDLFVDEWLDAYPYPTGVPRPDAAKRACPTER